MATSLRSIGGLISLLVGASLAQPNKEEILSKMLMNTLSSGHYSPSKLDDSFSKKIFSLYLKRLDPQKRFLLQSDIDSLKFFETDIDNELKLGTHGFFDFATNLLHRRIHEVELMTRDVLNNPMDLNAEDSIAVDPEKQIFSKTKQEQKMRWTRLLKYQVLTHVQDVKESKKKEAEAEKAKDKDKDKSKTKNPPKGKELSDAELEKESQKYIERSTKRLFERMQKEDHIASVSSYLNAVVNTYDPHTEYFKPEAKEDFDLSMTGTLEGIGAVLREEDGFIKVVSIVPGSASWRQKELKAEDKILKVAEGKEEPFDLVEASVDEAVRHIRGKKGTEVRLTVQKPSGQIKVISIIRDVVVVEETYAKSAIMSPRSNKRKFGYINLPAFYHDFNNNRGRTASADIQIELEKLKTDNVEGIVLDLRNNGGGALDDAVKMAGLFFKSGPVVQIKDKVGNSTVLNDQNTDITYDGPLVIMVNTFSASASEILAAALQDYGRAVIVGTDTSFGKGTVQTMVDLDNFLPMEFRNLKPMGTLKLTIQKFYRINGGTTQYKGVVPDILIPDSYTNLNIGEKNLDYPLPWDTVPSLTYPKWTKQKFDIPGLLKKEQARLKTDPFAKQIFDLTQKAQKQRDRTWVSVQKNKFIQEQETARKETEKFEALQKENINIAVSGLSQAKPSADSLEAEKEKKWFEQLSRDFYLREAINVLGDISPKSPEAAATK